MLTRSAREDDATLRHHLHHYVPWIESDFAHHRPYEEVTGKSDTPTGLQAIKTHLALDRIPVSNTMKKISVVRDPKDAVVSAYHFTKSILFGPAVPPLSAFVKVQCDAITGLGMSWADVSAL
jgi:hypothetical protein